jgi:LPS sulfotransferase NodH
MTSGRTGSELLVSLLNSHPQIACDGELLAVRRHWSERFVEGRATAVARRAGKRAYGIKVLPQHIHDTQTVPEPADWVRHLSSRGWQVIHLRRANRLHQALSMVRASKTQWHFRADEVGTFQPMAVDAMQTIGVMYIVEFLEHQIDQMLKGVEHLSLCYEDDLEDPASQARTVATICQRLGIDPAPTYTDVARIHPRDTKEMVSNYDEVVEEIRRNRWLEYASE